MAPRHRLRRTLLLIAAASAGLLGLAPSPASAVPHPAPMEGLDTGALHTCAIRAGEVLCWGSDSSAQLGNGPKTGGSWRPQPVAVAGTVLEGREVVQVVTGQAHTCALTVDDVVACWGSNAQGQLGDGTTDRRHVPTAVAVQGSPLERADLVELAVGLHHTCALTSGGTVACWGDNGSGQLGNGTTSDSTVPKAVATTGPLAGQQVRSLAAGEDSTCAATSPGEVACWGANDHGQLGDGSYQPSLEPTAVATALTPLDHRRVAEVSLARTTACARTTDRVVACWGRNDHGQVGDGAQAANQSVPSAVRTTGTPLGASAPAALGRGADQHCALLQDQTVACWGWNDAGQLGDGTTIDRTVPTALAVAGTGLEGKPILEVTVGYQHACALRSDGQAFCWGQNGSGQLGTGTTLPSLTPVPVQP